MNGFQMVPPGGQAAAAVPGQRPSLM